ncbi:hypothetical protein RSOL_078680 [Rhizoctonia solani AG-3 Rhs1AP]|uniref:Uncharacterized protein n=1 Tax=Rhizoctonia solani AG-3 Rhs1AP TaxID=1086054 RepID=X8IXT4_9AGAM|nr:hypothetical protein RSOL_078680 [Rhizoctonia solani AG-3 Rhs1AP]
MGKKKPSVKRTPTTTTASATNGGTSDVTSPTALSFVKALGRSPEDQKDASEPVQDEPKNATSPTDESSTGNAATTIAETPAAPLSKNQRKKAAAARKAAAALATDSTSSQQPATTEEVDTPTTPVDSSEANINMTKLPSDEPETSKPLENTPASPPEHDLEGDAWGLNDGEPSGGNDDVTKPAADEAPAPGAQDSNSADGVQVATVESKSEDDIPKDTVILTAEKPTESVSPPPAEEVSSDVIPNSSNDAPSLDTSNPLETKDDAVIPSTEIAAEGDPPNEDTTKPNGEPMDLPPRPSDDDNTPLSQFASRQKPIVDTSFVSDGLVNNGARKQTPSLAGENLGSSQSGSNSNTFGAGVFSNGPSRTTAPSTSPTSGVPARGPAAVGFGSPAPQTPTTTTGFGFGFGSPQKSTPKTASGMSWSSSSPPKPAAKVGWGNWLNKARETLEHVVNDEPASAPAPTPHAPPVRSSSVDRPAQPGPSNSNSTPDAAPASLSRPTKGMTAFEMRMAALNKKPTGPNKDSSPAPMPETPKTSSSVIPPSDPFASPISPSQSTQSYTQSRPSPLPLPPSTSEPTEETASHMPDPAMVTSALPPLPRESTAEFGKVGKMAAKLDHPEAPISSKMATTGLRLHTQSVVPDGRRSASPVTKRGSIGSETERPSLADMRSSSAPTPKTPITSASPKAPASFNIGAGLGTTNRLGGFRFGGAGFPGFRPNHGPSPISTPMTEKNEAKLEKQNDRDDLSSVVEANEHQDLDSQVGESEVQDLDSLVDESGADALGNLPITIDVESPAIPTTFNTAVPDVAPTYANPWDSPPAITTEALPAATLETIAPLPSPIKSEFEPEAAIPDDKTIADPSDLADVTPESAPKDEPRPESPVVSEHAVTPTAEKPTEVPVPEEPVVAPGLDESAVPPVVESPVVSSFVDEPIVVPAPHEEAPASESTEPVVAPEPQVDEPLREISTEETPEIRVEPVVEVAIEPAVEPTVESAVEPPVELTAEPAVEPVVESVVEPPVELPVEPSVEPTVEPTVEPAVESVVESAVESTVEPTVEPTVPIVEPAAEPTTESVVEPVAAAVAEPTPETITEPASEPVVQTLVEPATETPIEPTPEPVVQLVVEPPEPVVVPLVESVSDPVVESVTAALTIELLPEPASLPLPTSPVPSVVELAPAAPTEAPVEKSAPPKLTLDVSPADESFNPESSLPLTSAIPATPATPAKKKDGKDGKDKKGKADKTDKKDKKNRKKKGTTAVTESAPIIPATTSESTPQSEPAFTSEPKVEPIRDQTREESVTPIPVEAKVEPTPEAVEPTPTIEVLPAPEAPKEPETTPEIVEEKPKEEPVSSAKPKKPKSRNHKNRNKSSAAPTQVASPTDDIPPTPVEKAEQPEAEVLEVLEPTVAEPVMVEPTMVEPAVVEPAVVEPAVVEPISIESVLVESVPVEPAPVEPAAVESVVGEPEVGVEVALTPATEEVSKNEDDRTTVPDEGFETPKAAPRELPELVPEPVEAALQSPVVEAPIEVIVIPHTETEPSPEPILVPSTEVRPELIPIPDPQPELEPELESEPIPVSIVEPTVDPVVEVVIESLADVAAEAPVEPAYEPVPELVGAPTVELIAEPIAEPTIAPSTEEVIIEEAQPVAELIPELQSQPPVEPVFELAVSPVAEAPKEEVPTLEVQDASPSPSKSSKKKNKKKGAAKAIAVMEDATPSPANDDPVVEIVNPEVPMTSTLEDGKVSEEVAVVPGPAAPKKKGRKSKAVSVVPTPVEEQAPALPPPVEAPVTLVDTPQIEEMEEALPTVAPPVEILELPVQTEATPKIEVIELPDDHNAEAASFISVAQVYPDVTTPTLPAIEVAPIEHVSEAPFEPEPMSVLVDLPQSPATSTISVSSPRPSIFSPWPQGAFLATRGASPPPRSVTSNTGKHDEILEALQIPINPTSNPVRPVLEHVVSVEVTIPLSASPVSDSASQSSQDIGSFGREASFVPRESQSTRRTGSVSSNTSFDTDSPSTVEKTKMRPSMPPLISIPVPSPIATSSPYLDSMILQPPARPEPERKPSAKITEAPVPSIVTNDLPTNDVPPNADATSKPSSSRILDGFSPLRWFGFGGLSSPAVEDKPAEDKPIEVKPVEAKLVEVQPVEVRPVEVKSIDT